MIQPPKMYMVSTQAGGLSKVMYVCTCKANHLAYKLYYSDDNINYIQHNYLSIYTYNIITYICAYIGYMHVY